MGNCGGAVGRRLGTLAVVLALVGVAAACADDDAAAPAPSWATDAAPSTAPSTVAPGAGTAATATTTAPTTTAAAPPRRGGRIVVGVEAEVGNPWVPQVMQCDSSCIFRANTIFDSVLATAADGTMTPELAESYTVSDDGTLFTVKVRPGVAFHDGTPVDAAAIVENFQRYITSSLTAAGLRDVARRPDGSPDITILDPMTYQVRTSRPWFEFPRYWTGYVASPTWLKEVDADPSKATRPVGSGPFRFASWSPGDKLVVERNPTYWQDAPDGQPLPYLDEIEFRVLADSSTRQRALEVGDVDLIQTSSGQSIAALRELAAKGEVELLEQGERGETFYILLHVGQEGSPLQDRRVRCGLAAATDSESLAVAVGDGVFPVANGLFSPGQEGHLADTGNQTYDPETAKRLIAEYTAERGKPKVIYATIPDPASLQTAQLLQQWWSEAGVEVQIDQIEQSTLITNALLGAPDFNAFGWRNHAGFVADQQYVWWHESTALPAGQLALNFGRLRDPEISRLLDESRSQPDPAARRAAAEAVNRRFAEQCWALPTTWARWGIASSPDLGGVGSFTLTDGTEGYEGGGWVVLSSVYREG